MKLKIAILASVAAMLGAAAAAFGSGSPPVPPGLDRMSNHGIPVDVSTTPAAERGLLDHIKVSGQLSALGSRSGIAFYRGQNDAGETCLITGSSTGRAPRFGSSFCLDQAVNFPSAKLPVLDQSTFTVDGTGTNHALAVNGFAADGVATVGVVDEYGVAHTTPVVDNVYAMTDVPTEAVRSIVAFAPNGEQIFTASLPEA